MTKSEYAVLLHQKGYNCFQSVLCAFHEELGMEEADLFRIGEGFGLGMGNMKNTCGAVAGAVACMGLLNSAGDLSAPHTTKRATMALSNQLTADLCEKHGSNICEVLKGMTGSPVVPCDTCIADAARAVEEILAAHKA